MNRRNLISAALPAAMAGAFLAGAGAAGAEPTETPVRRMFREWQPFSAWVNGPEGDSATEAEFDWIDRQRIALEDRMMAEPAQGPLDVLAKMIAWTHYGEDDLPPAAHLPQLWAEASTLLAHPASSA